MVALRSRVLVPVLSLLLLSVLAGCLDDDDPPSPSTGTAAEGTGNEAGGNTTRNLTTADANRPSVEGFVLDESRTPLVGAKVLVQNEGLEIQTDEKGHYAFGGLLDNRQYVLIAEYDGFERKAQQIIAIDDKVVRLDFVLTEVPKEVPYDEILEGAGLISCQAFVGFGHDHGGDGTEYEERCGGVAPDPNAKQVLEFATDPGIAGIVVEVAWDSPQPLSDFMMVTVESVGYGDLDKQFAQVIGPSILKIELAQGDVAKYYGGQGGNLRVIVDVHFEDDDEQAAGAAVAFQQPFEVRVSNFYVQPQPQSYSAFDGDA